MKEWVVLQEEETRRVGPAGGGGSHHSAGHHHLLLLLTNTLPLSASPGPTRLCSKQWDLDQDSHIDREQDRETGSWTYRIRVPAAGSRHAGHGEDGRARSSGLERILQRGGRSLSARFTFAFYRHFERVRPGSHRSGSDPVDRKFENFLDKKNLQKKNFKFQLLSREITGRSSRVAVYLMRNEMEWSDRW